MSVPPIPPGPRLRPYLACHDAAAALSFYMDVFGFEQEACLKMPDGRIGYAELRSSEVFLQLSDAFPEMNIAGPRDLGGTPVSLLLYVEDVDATVEKALARGATQEGETKNEFFGDRAAKLVDPFGHRWFIHTRIEDVSTEEMVRRFEQSMA